MWDKVQVSNTSPANFCLLLLVKSDEAMYGGALTKKYRFFMSSQPGRLYQGERSDRQTGAGIAQWLEHRTRD